MRKVRELVDAVRKAYPHDHFLDRFWESCRENPAKKKAYRTYDDALRLLDMQSWEILKAKAIGHYCDHRPGQLKQGLFNQLNESFAYRHLLRKGYRKVRILPELGRKVPDLEYFVGRTHQLCEVKTISVSDEEIARRASSKAYANVYLQLGNGFFNKLTSTIGSAKLQIGAQGTSG